MPVWSAHATIYQRCSTGNYITRNKRCYATHWHPVLSPRYAKTPWPEPKPGFDPALPAISADILGLALIGRFQNIDAAWQAHQRYPIGAVIEAFAELLGLPLNVCLSLADWHDGLRACPAYC